MDGARGQNCPSRVDEMITERRRITKLSALALAATLGSGLLTNVLAIPKKEEVVVEMAITGFLTPIVVKVQPDRKMAYSGGSMAYSGGGGLDHHPPDVPGSYSYLISVLSRRREYVILRLNLSLYFRDGTEKQINEKIRIGRTNPFEAEYGIGLKVKSYFGDPPNRQRS